MLLNVAVHQRCNRVTTADPDDLDTNLAQTRM